VRKRGNFWYFVKTLILILYQSSVIKQSTSSENKNITERRKWT